MLKWTMGKYKEIVFIFAIVMIAITFYGYRTEAKDFKETFSNLESIAKDLKDPNNWLRQYLINHNVDSVKAKTWSLYLKGALVDSSGTPISGIPYLEKDVMPELGIYKVIKDNGEEKTMDTLWDFRSKK